MTEPDLLSFTVPPEGEGRRVDAFLAERGELSRARVQKLCETGNVLLDGVSAKKNARLRAGSTLSCLLPAPAEAKALPQDLPLEIVYEDSCLLVVNKPKGMVVHPAPGNPDGTLVNALLYHCGESLSGIGGVLRPGIVHRIDKDTSGLLMVAKTDAAHRSLAAQIAAHSFLREYETVVYGSMPQQEGTIDLPIGRSSADRKKMCVRTDHSRRAVTHYTVLAQYEGFSHLRCRLETGRTHQIRVHLAYLGHPVAGDPIYGPRKCISSLKGQCLHARTLGFTHPVTGERMEFSSPLPAYFQQFLRMLSPKV